MPITISGYIKTVLGGGISGLAAAISLAGKGEKVELVERASRIGIKFPESIHGFRNYSNIDETEYITSRGYSIDHLMPIHNIVKLSPSLSPSEIYSKDRPMFYAVKRGNAPESIDMQLYKQAENMGVKFRFGETINANEADIVATGAKFINGMGYGHNYTNVDVDNDSIIFLLNDRYAPKGYAYAIPYGKNEVSIVVTSFDSSSFNQMQVLFNRLMKEVPNFSKLAEGGERGQAFAKIGFYSIPETAVVQKRLIVGEAAGFVEADRGFGMHYALESGFLAAKSIIDGLDYDALWKASFEKHLLKAFKRRLILNRLGNAHYDQLINAGTRMSINEYTKHKEKQSIDIVKQLLLHLHTTNEVRKLRKRYDLKKVY